MQLLCCKSSCSLPACANQTGLGPWSVPSVRSGHTYGSWQVGSWYIITCRTILQVLLLQSKQCPHNSVTALDIFQTGDIYKVMKVDGKKQQQKTVNHCNQSDTWPSVLPVACTRALLGNTLLLYPSRTHTHSFYHPTTHLGHTHTLILSMCCVDLFENWSNKITVGMSDWLLIILSFWYMMTLTGKIPEITC